MDTSIPQMSRMEPNQKQVLLGLGCWFVAMLVSLSVYLGGVGGQLEFSNGSIWYLKLINSTVYCMSKTIIKTLAWTPTHSTLILLPARQVSLPEVSAYFYSSPLFSLGPGTSKNQKNQVVT